jgi:hypothetical protein
MADIVSSDGHCTVRLHTDWASVLVWTDLTGTITIRRNGVDIATMTTGRQIYYDHYFSPLGSTATYTVTNGSTTSTGAHITVPSHPRRWTWLKSGIDPNLSLPVGNLPLEDITWPKRGGAFDILGGGTFTIEGGLGMRRWPFTFWTDAMATRTQLLALFDAGPFYVQTDPSTHETDMWATVRPGSDVQSHRVGRVLPNAVLQVSAELVECPQPAAASLGNIAPGWSWDHAKALWASWDATKAAKPTWLDVVKHGIT